MGVHLMSNIKVLTVPLFGTCYKSAVPHTMGIDMGKRIRLNWVMGPLGGPLTTSRPLRAPIGEPLIYLDPPPKLSPRLGIALFPPACLPTCISSPEHVFFTTGDAVSFGADRLRLDFFFTGLEREISLSAAVFPVLYPTLHPEPGAFH